MVPELVELEWNPAPCETVLEGGVYLISSPPEGQLQNLAQCFQVLPLSKTCSAVSSCLSREASGQIR